MPDEVRIVPPSFETTRIWYSPALFPLSLLAVANTSAGPVTSRASAPLKTKSATTLLTEALSSRP